MIFPTTLILALFLAPIARAAPQPCHDSELSTPVGQYSLMGPEPQTALFKAVYNPIYDNPNESLNIVACSELVSRYPQFKNVPLFPNIGGAPNTTFNSPNCGALWEITNVATGQTIFYIGIDASSSFDLSLSAFVKVGGQTATGSVEVSAVIVGHL